MYKTKQLNSFIKALMISLLISNIYIGEIYADILNGSHWVIKPGDSLYKIARNIFPDNTKKQAQLRKELIKQNPQAFKNGASSISVGDKLQLPNFAVKQKKSEAIIALKKPEIIKPEPQTQALIEAEQLVTPDPQDIIGQVIINVGNLSAHNRGSIRELNRRSSIYRGDTINTGERSLTQIRLKDGALLSLRPLTELRLAEYRYNGQEDGSEKSIIELIKGGFRTITGAIGHKNKQNYQVRTTIATIGIRGTHYSLVLCQQASCSDDETGAVEDGLYGGVADGSIVIENQTGIHRFNNDQFFQLTSANTEPVEFLLPPTILKHGVAKHSGTTKKTKQNISKQIKSAPRRLAVIFEANQPDFARRPKIAVGDADIPRVAEEFLPDKAPNGSGMLIGFNQLDDTGVITGTSASVIIAPNNNNTIFLGPNRTPIAGREASIDPQTNALVLHEIVMVSPAGALASLVPSSIGGNPALGVNWGRWNGDFTVLEDGQPLDTRDNFHYIYSENLTTPSQLTQLAQPAQLGGLVGTFAFTSGSTQGTRPTDNFGNVGTNLANVNMSVDFQTATVNTYTVDTMVNGNFYQADASNISFQNLDQFNITESATACSSGQCIGEASVLFVGGQAQGAISSYHIEEPDGSRGVTGTNLLIRAAAPQ